MNDLIKQNPWSMSNVITHPFNAPPNDVAEHFSINDHNVNSDSLFNQINQRDDYEDSLSQLLRSPSSYNFLNDDTPQAVSQFKDRSNSLHEQSNHAFEVVKHYLCMFQSIWIRMIKMKQFYIL